MKKRITALFFAVIMLLSCFACAKPDEGELIAEYKALYEKSLLINDIIYGGGLPYKGEYDLEGITETTYVEVSDESPYRTAAALEAAVLEVYTVELYEDVIKNTLFGSGEQGMFANIPRYKESNGVLLIDLNYKPFVNISGRCVLDEAYVVRSSAGGAVIGAPYFVGEVRQQKDKQIEMFLNDNGWRFDKFSL